MKNDDLSQLKQKALEAKFSAPTLQLLFSILDRHEKGEEIPAEEKQELSRLIDEDMANVEEDARVMEDLVLALGEEKGRLEAQAEIARSRAASSAGTVPTAPPVNKPTPTVVKKPGNLPPIPTFEEPVASKTEETLPKAEEAIVAGDENPKESADSMALTAEEQAAIEKIQDQLRAIADGKK